MHRRSTSAWVNETARLDHEKLIAEKEAQTQNAMSSSVPIDETEIMKKVFGERCGHVRWKGQKLKGGTSLGRQGSQSTFQATSRSNIDPQVVQRMCDKHNSYAEHTNMKMQRLIENLTAAFPHVPIDPISPPPTWTVDDFITDEILDDVETTDDPQQQPDDSGIGDNQPNLGDD